MIDGPNEPAPVCILLVVIDVDTTDAIVAFNDDILPDVIVET